MIWLLWTIGLTLVSLWLNERLNKTKRNIAKINEAVDYSLKSNFASILGQAEAHSKAMTSIELHGKLVVPFSKIGHANLELMRIKCTQYSQCARKGPLARQYLYMLEQNYYSKY